MAAQTGGVTPGPNGERVPKAPGWRSMRSDRQGVRLPGDKARWVVVGSSTGVRHSHWLVDSLESARVGGLAPPRLLGGKGSLYHSNTVRTAATGMGPH